MELKIRWSFPEDVSSLRVVRLADGLFDSVDRIPGLPDYLCALCCARLCHDCDCLCVSVRECGFGRVPDPVGLWGPPGRFGLRWQEEARTLILVIGSPKRICFNSTLGQVQFYASVILIEFLLTEA